MEERSGVISMQLMPWLKWLVALIFGVVILTLGYMWGAGESVSDTTSDSTETVKSNTIAEVDPCEFSEADKSYTKPTEYNAAIFGGEAFDTVVCGYLTHGETDMRLTEDDEPNIKDVAKFNVTSFADNNFKTAITAAITEGNTVNTATAGAVALGCGCYSDSGLMSDLNEKIANDASFTALKASSAAAPVKVKLSFIVRDGRGCSCCHLFDKITVL